MSIKDDSNTIVEVECISLYWDIQLNEYKKVNERYKVTKARADELEEANVARIVEN